MMGKVGLYESWRVLSEDCVYLIICRPFAGRNLIKVGYSGSLILRYNNLITGIPFPVKEVLYVRCEGKRQALATEKQVHRALASYRTAREWFALDLSDQEQLRALTSAYRSAFCANNNREYQVRALNMAFVREAATEKIKESRKASQRRSPAQAERKLANVGRAHCEYAEAAKAAEKQWDSEMRAYLARKASMKRKRA